uniref:CARD domain-containing protein n=1 Tax=Plectus sambesii TaxID=2011161 RepID=A0A914UJY1_9BILA
MDPKHIKLLNQNQFRLVRDMAPDDVVDYLKGSIFLQHHADEIMKRPSSKEKNRELLILLKQRGEFAFDKFVEALKESEQTSLVELLQPQQSHAEGNLGGQGQSGAQGRPGVHNSGAELRDDSAVHSRISHQGNIYIDSNQ